MIADRIPKASYLRIRTAFFFSLTVFIFTMMLALGSPHFREQRTDHYAQSSPPLPSCPNYHPHDLGHQHIKETPVTTLRAWSLVLSHPSLLIL